MLIQISLGYPLVRGRFYTRYAPVRRSSSEASSNVTPRLACVKPAASVHPEPGSNSSSLNFKVFRLICLTIKEIFYTQNGLFSCLKIIVSNNFLTLSIQYVYELFYLFLSRLLLKRVQI